ncbi:MAG TPA: sugar ABC transporter ATP-binding protein [Thermoleophilaceae bacterium]|nr:sugar ABC transporter ATP-binding protein [Thermoleophilaceae bacterium]
MAAQGTTLVPDRDPVGRVRVGAALEVRGLEKRYGGVRALAGVDMSVAAGEIHGLLGANGAGKSTLLRIVTGAEHADAGEILIDDEPIAPRDVRDAHELGIRMIFQHQQVVPELSVASNFCLGEETTQGGVLRPSRDRERARRGLAALDLEIDPDAPLAGLTFAERQMVEIGKALEARSRILILDEPTAALGKDESERLFAMLRQLQASHGTTVVYVSHRLEEIVSICDRVTVLRDGLVAGRVTVEPTTTPGELARLVVGASQAAAREPAAAHSAAVDAPVALRVRGLASEGGLVDASLEVRRGEILGVYGMMGSGRTELLRALMAADRPTAGTVELDGAAVRLRGPAQAVEAGVGLVPEDRHADGLFMIASVALNALSASLRRFSRAGVVRESAGRKAASEIAGRLRIKAPSLGTAVRNLSGGNQQKVVLARWLLARARVLLLDDPTVGVDVGARREIYRTLDDLRASGIAVVVTSSDADELLEVADRIVIMRAGRSTATVPRAEADADRLLALALGEDGADALS